MSPIEYWHAAWQALGIAKPDSELLVQLQRRYGEAQRHYHTQQHLSECFSTYTLLAADAESPAHIILALWFHDAIYDVQGHGNEQRSADWASAALRAAGVSPDVAERIHALVMVTRHDAAPVTQDEKILVDVDLVILGAERNRFDEYERQIRAEYAWVDEALFCSKRGAILQAFLDRPHIYHTALGRARFEVQARENLQRAIKDLAPASGHLREI